MNRTTVVNDTEAVSTEDNPIANGQIEVTISNANDVDGVRVYLTPLEASAGGAGGTGGAETGGVGPTGGFGSTGGATAGGIGTGGIGTGGLGTGGLGTGGIVATGGTGTGAFATGRLVSTGGAVATGTGGTLASGGWYRAGAPSGGEASSDSGDDEGCGCQVPGRRPAPPWTPGVALLGLVVSRSRRA